MFDSCSLICIFKKGNFTSTVQKPSSCKVYFMNYFIMSSTEQINWFLWNVRFCKCIYNINVWLFNCKQSQCCNPYIHYSKVTRACFCEHNLPCSCLVSTNTWNNHIRSLYEWWVSVAALEMTSSLFLLYCYTIVFHHVVPNTSPTGLVQALLHYCHIYRNVSIKYRS